MSTPNTTAPMTQPSSASKKATGHISTPHTIASPAPRSVPSPAATRKDHAAKTPVNHPTAGSSHGSKTLASTPMVHSLSQTGLGSSPGQHFGTPGALHGLGVDLGSGTPNLNVPTPMLAAAGMVPSMSEIMGVGAGRKRNEDEERKAKMNKILKKIGKPKGRVSKAGIERVARRCGLTAVGDDAEISLAGVGEKMMLVVNLKGDVVEGVVPQIFVCEAEKKEEEQYMGIAASKVLLQNLRVPSGIALQSKLDQFAINLDRLAKMDRMSKGQVDCFEAINGVYTSLKKLYDLEKDAVKALRELKNDDADGKAAHEVLCKRSGRPFLHDNGRIGLSLGYWTPLQHPKTSAGKADGALVDEPQDDHLESDIWSLRIEAQPCAVGMYPSLRASDAWLPETFDIAQQEQGIPWQDPPNTLINTNPTDTGDAMAIDGERLPDLRFVAKLDPPVILPLQIAATILATLGDQYSQSITFPIYHLNLLGIKSQDLSTKVVSEQSILVPRTEEKEEDTHILHEYVLDIPKADLAYTLEELPFSHPRQLIELLPTLRQWASTGHLLQTAFSKSATESIRAPANAAANGTNGSPHKKPSDSSSKAAAHAKDLKSILDHVEPEAAAASKTRIDLTFASGSQLPLATPNFSLAIADSTTTTTTTTTFTGEELSHVVFQMMPNADVVVEHFDDGHLEKIPVSEPEELGKNASSEEGQQQTEQNSSSDGLLKKKKKKKLAKALEVSNDLGIWVEWMRRQSHHHS
ncbi:Mediator of RNA polymerase II transcription subunit 1 [Cercospora zeina]